MTQDLMKPITDAERTIAARLVDRQRNALDQRGFLAAEIVADELTRLVAEVRVLRYLHASEAARR